MTKLFGGKSLLELSKQGREKTNPAEGEGAETAGVANVQFAAGRLATRGVPKAIPQRETVLTVDPTRCKMWKYHDRDTSKFNEHDCADLIESLSLHGQKMPCVGRRLADDPNYDYELIFGGRRRFSCEHLHLSLLIKVTDASDADCFVLMHLENARRKDITPMERALSLYRQVKEKVFPSYEALAKALGVERSKGQIAKMVRAAELMQVTTIASLFPDKTRVPVELAYQVAARMDNDAAKRIIMQKANNLQRKGAERRGNPAQMLRALRDSPDHSASFEPSQKLYPVGDGYQMVVTRNVKGKVTFAFAKGLKGVSMEKLIEVAKQLEQEEAGANVS